MQIRYLVLGTLQGNETQIWSKKFTAEFSARFLCYEPGDKATLTYKVIHCDNIILSVMVPPSTQQAALHWTDLKLYLSWLQPSRHKCRTGKKQQTTAEWEKNSCITNTEICWKISEVVNNWNSGISMHCNNTTKLQSQHPHCQQVWWSTSTSVLVTSSELIKCTAYGKCHWHILLYTLSSWRLVATFFTELDDTDPDVLVAACVIYREQELMELSPQASPKHTPTPRKENK